jgi:hypothetical protein
MMMIAILFCRGRNATEKWWSESRSTDGTKATRDRSSPLLFMASPTKARNERETPHRTAPQPKPHRGHTTQAIIKRRKHKKRRSKLAKQVINEEQQSTCYNNNYYC